MTALKSLGCCYPQLRRELATQQVEVLSTQLFFLRDFRQNKGTILKASVDYIRRMQRDMEKSRMQDAKQRQLEEANKKMRLRIQVSINLLLPPHLHSLSLSSCYYYLPPLSVFILLPPHLLPTSLPSLCLHATTSPPPFPLSVFMLLPPHLLPSLTSSQELELTARAHGIPTPSLNPETQQLAVAADQTLGELPVSCV